VKFKDSNEIPRNPAKLNVINSISLPKHQYKLELRELDTFRVFSEGRICPNPV
jgi:hypothetical protein